MNFAWRLSQKRYCKGFILLRCSGFNRYPSQIVASLDKMFLRRWLSLASNMQQILWTSVHKNLQKLFQEQGIYRNERCADHPPRSYRLNLSGGRRLKKETIKFYMFSMAEVAMLQNQTKHFSNIAQLRTSIQIVGETRSPLRFSEPHTERHLPRHLDEKEAVIPANLNLRPKSVPQWGKSGYEYICFWLLLYSDCAWSPGHGCEGTHPPNILQFKYCYLVQPINQRDLYD